MSLRFFIDVYSSSLSNAGLVSELDAESLAIFSPRAYVDIFGERKSRSSQKKQTLSVVRIQNGSRKIYRKYVARSITGLSTNKVLLSPNALQQLRIEPGAEVLVEKDCWWNFFWNHSNTTVQVSFRMGAIGIAVGILGIIFTILL